jgi:CHAT domain-containing protein/tetratricopeptide (TPR) repeat protein
MQILCLLSFISIFTVSAYGQGWRDNYLQAQNFCSQENYDEAFTSASEALKKYQDESGATNESYASILHLLSIITYAQGKYTEGLDFVNREIQILAQNKDTTYATALTNQAQFFNQLGQYESSILSLSECHSILTSYFKENEKSLIENGLGLGITYFLKGDADNAHHWLSNSVTLAQQNSRYPDNSIEAFYYYGQLLLESGESGKAINIFSSAKQLYESIGQVTSSSYALCLAGLAEAYSKNKNYTEAENFFSQAQNLCEKAEDRTDREYFEIINWRAINLQLMNQQALADELLAKIGANTSGQAALASALSNNAVILQARGDYAKAESCFLEAIKKYSLDDKASLRDYAETLKNFAIMYSEKGDQQNALLRINEAKQMTEKIFGSGHRKYLDVLNLSALILFRKGDVMQAKETYLTVLRLADDMQVKPTAEQFSALNGFASILQREGNFSKADSIYASLLARYSSGKVLPDSYYLITLNNFAASKQVQGQLLEALHLLWRMSSATMTMYGRSGVEYANTLNNRAILYLKTGDLNSARFAIDSALQVLEKESGNASVVYAGSLTNLGHYFQLTGDYTKAEPYLKKARDIVLSTRGKESNEYAGTLNELALLYQKLGNYFDAGNLLKESKNIIEKNIGKVSTEYSTALQNIATLSQLQGKYADAEPLMKEALEIDLRLSGEKSPQYAIALQNLATLYQKLGKQNDAEALLEKVLSLTGQTLGEEHPSYVTTLSNLAALYQDKGNFDKAELIWKKSVELRRKVLGEGHPDYAKSLFGLAGVYHAKGQLEEAKKYYDPVINHYEKQIKDFFSTLSDKEKSAFYATIKPVFDAYQDFSFEYLIHYSDRQPEVLKQLYNLQLLTKAILLEASSKVRARILSSNDTLLKGQFKRWLTAKQEMVRYYNYTQAEREQLNIDLSAIESKANDLEKKLAEQSDAFRTQFDKSNVTWDLVKYGLKENEVAVEILRVKKRFIKDSIYYTALLIGKNNESPEFVLWPQGKSLEERWFKYHRNTIKFQYLDTISYQKFWLPLEKKIVTGNVIYISCDGVFNKVNFNSLFNPARRRWVIEDFTLRLLSSTRELIQQPIARQEKPTASLFGFADFNLGLPNVQTSDTRGTARAFGFEGTEIPMLPATEKELDGIYHVLQSKNWDVQSFEKNEATEENLKKLESPKLIHIATHGFFLSDIDVNENEELLNNPLFRSGVLLAGAGLERNIAQQNDDGVLTAFEAMNLNLDKTELVVLSACETGLGEIRNGEGVYGLQRSFLVAGAQSILMSLWQVDDVATQELMNTFYSFWLDGVERHQAFRVAQLKLKEKYPDPYYWGAFVMVGN